MLNCINVADELAIYKSTNLLGVFFLANAIGKMIWELFDIITKICEQFFLGFQKWMPSTTKICVRHSV